VATSDVPGISPVYADTNAPQIMSIETDVAYSPDLFTISFLIKARVHRNTIQSIALEYKPKTVVGPLADPIFAAPCSKVENASVSATTVEGNSLALQARSRSGDWFIEEFVIQSKTKLSKNQGPCLGSYLITGITVVDAAKHTLTVTSNLGSTTPATSSGTKQPTTSTKSTYTDVAIMQSNIWSSRIDLAPCVAGSNLAASLTNVVINGKTTQAMVAPTVVSTDRVVCAPTIGFNLASALFVLKEDSFASDVNALEGLRIFDYATQVNQSSAEIAKLKADLATLTAANAALIEENTKLKAVPAIAVTPKPAATTTKKATVTTTKKPAVKSTSKSKPSSAPSPKWTRSTKGGNSKWKPRVTATPKSTR
jgi:hypothetical protein